MASNDIRSKSNAAMNAYYYANQIGKVGKAIGKGYMSAGNFIANNNAAINAGFNLIPNPDTTLNTTELISGQVYDKASDMLMTNPYTALVGLGMKGAKKADLLSTATDFNDKDTGLNFFQHAGNFLTSLTPGSKLFSTKINPVDKSRLNGIASYTWHNDLDKYNNKGKAFYVTFGGKKMKEAADNYQLAVNTAVDISDEGARAMKFDPYQVAKKSEQELRGGFDSRYGLLPAGKQGTTLQFTKRTLSKYKVKKYQLGGTTPQMDSGYQYYLSEDFRNDWYNEHNYSKEDIERAERVFSYGQKSRDMLNKQLDEINIKKNWNPSEQTFEEFIQDYYNPDDENNLFFQYYPDGWEPRTRQYNDHYTRYHKEANKYEYLDQYYNTLTDDQKKDFMEQTMRFVINVPSDMLKNGGKIYRHQTGGSLSIENLPKWLFFDDEKNEYVTDFYANSQKEDIEELKKFTKENLPEWKVWQSPLANKRYFILPEKEANRRDMQILEQIEASSMQGSTGSKAAPPVGYSIGIDGKELTYVGNQVGSNGKPYNFEDGNGGTYWFPEYQKNGGKVNIIPEGALHKNKHHLEDVDKKFEDVTKKGIPVIVESEGGEVIQQAEVERQEIIFRLKVTKKLEELAKEHTDEAAIEAGKLLVKEILYNTVDNTQEMI